MKFNELKLKKELLESIKEMGYDETTSIQARCIPAILAGKDIIGQSLTGSGKTAAFGIPLINKITPGIVGQVLVLTPTRELAHQVKEHLNSLGKHLGIKSASVYGGVGFDLQVKRANSSEIIVATPGRLLDLLQRRWFSLQNVRFVVLDEADRMFDMGFERDVDRILQLTPKQKQVTLFSATMPNAAKKIASKYLNSPIHIQEKLLVEEALMKQTAYIVRREDKFSLLIHLLKRESGTAIVFCRTKREVDKIARNIKKQGLSVEAVHGDITQNKRHHAVGKFKEGMVDVLVATDVAARGIDIKNVSHVYNYDVPDNAEDYTHRIGRTARAGAKGEAVTLVTEYDQQEYAQIARRMNIEEESLPQFERIILERREHYSGTNSSPQRSHYGRSYGGDRTGGRFGAGRSYGRSSTRSYGGGERKRFGGSTRSYGFGEKSYAPRRENYGNSSAGYGEKREFKPRAEGVAPRREHFGSGKESFREQRRIGGEQGRNYGEDRGGTFGGRDNRRSFIGRETTRSFNSERKGFGRSTSKNYSTETKHGIHSKSNTTHKTGKPSPKKNKYKNHKK